MRQVSKVRKGIEMVDILIGEARFEAILVGLGDAQALGDRPQVHPCLKAEICPCGCHVVAQPQQE